MHFNTNKKKTFKNINNCIEFEIILQNVRIIKPLSLENNYSNLDYDD